MLNSEEDLDVDGGHLQQAGASQAHLTVEEIGDRRVITYQAFPIWSLLALFSFVGVLVRILLLRLEDFPGAPVPPVIYPEAVGCFIIGWLISQREEISVQYYPLYVGLATGLCGSITTFSTWSLATAQEFLNLKEVQRNGGQNFLAGIGVLTVVLGISIVSLKLGEHAGFLFRVPRSEASFGDASQVIFKIERFHWRSVGKIDLGAATISFIAFIVVLVISIWMTIHRDIAWAVLFGSLGTFVRYRLAGQNSKYAHFPAGTFLVNVGGSVILGALYITTRTVELPPNACHAINGLSDGFCGCLTTVSTFVVELYTLPRPRAYVYALSSIVAAQIPLIIILGVPHWTGNLTSSCQNLS